MDKNVGGLLILENKGKIDRIDFKIFTLHNEKIVNIKFITT